MTIGLVNYRMGAEGPIAAGLVVDGQVHVLGTAIGGGVEYRTLTDAYADWTRVDAALRGGLGSLGAGMPVDDVTLLAPSLEPTSLYFAGFNYRDHVANMMKVFDLPDDPEPKAVGLKPWHNLKPRNTLCGHGSTVDLPTDRVDWEVELAVVIGRPARNIRLEDALDHVAGYSVGIDLSARDRAFRPNTPVESVARMDWIAQKGFDGACPLGPWLAPAFTIPDPQALDLSLSVNGVMKQDSNTREMIFTVAEAIEHLASMVTLSPGDIILTGTPAGTGAESGQCLVRGDTIRASVERIGELRVETK